MTTRARLVLIAAALTALAGCFYPDNGGHGWRWHHPWHHGEGR
jgi:hypothetical protein